MKHLIAVRVFLEQLHGVLPGVDDPEHIHLDEHEARVRLLQQDIIGRGPVRQGLEFIAVRVEPETEPLGLQGRVKVAEAGDDLAGARAEIQRPLQEFKRTAGGEKAGSDPI